MSKKTTIYLDVDGVLNAVPPSRTLREDSGWENWDSSRIHGYIITWSPDLVDALNALAARDDVEVRWLTTWRELAVEKIVPGIGLDGAEWSVVSDGALGSGYAHTSIVPAWGKGGWWKMNSIADDIDHTNPDQIVWIDDDLVVDPESARGLLAAKGLENKSLLIAPYTRVGLTREHISAIIEFVDNN